PAVRTRLVALQRRLGEAGPVVMEGRDIGTVVFPDAPLKVYLTADAAERTRRRAADLRARGTAVDEALLTREITERDQRDANRAMSPRVPAADAVVVVTTGLDLGAVVEQMVGLARARGRR